MRYFNFYKINLFTLITFCIISCGSNKQEEISNLLKNQGKKSNYYHAGLKSDKRSAIQQKWINNEFNIMIATNAFGMGIDKSDVRTVIHFDL